MCSNNRAWFSARVIESSLIRFFGDLLATLPYAILAAIVFFDSTQNCGHRCFQYFKQLPVEEPIQVHGQGSTGHIVIVENDDARKIKFYTLSKVQDKIIISGNTGLKSTKTYTKIRTKAKQVRFSDFKKTDPVLSSFEKLEEPKVPQKYCSINDIHDIIDIQLD